jgi:hypothetical protein
MYFMAKKIVCGRGKIGKGGGMCELENMKCIFACRLGCLVGKKGRTFS